MSDSVSVCGRNTHALFAHVLRSEIQRSVGWIMQIFNEWRHSKRPLQLSAPIIAWDHEIMRSWDHELPYSRQVFDLAVFMPDALPHMTPEVILCLRVKKPELQLTVFTCWITADSFFVSSWNIKLMSEIWAQVALKHHLDVLLNKSFYLKTAERSGIHKHRQPHSRCMKSSMKLIQGDPVSGCLEKVTRFVGLHSPVNMFQLIFSSSCCHEVRLHATNTRWNNTVCLVWKQHNKVKEKKHTRRTPQTRPLTLLSWCQENSHSTNLNVVTGILCDRQTN